MFLANARLLLNGKTTVYFVERSGNKSVPLEHGGRHPRVLDLVFMMGTGRKGQGSSLEAPRGQKLSAKRFGETLPSPGGPRKARIQPWMTHEAESNIGDPRLGLEGVCVVSCT